MNLKKDIIRRIAAILVIIYLLNICSAICFAEDKESDDDNTAKPIAMVDNNENSYAAYLSKYSESDYSQDSIVYNLNDIILEKEKAEFVVNVKNSGLYRIGMSYKALNTNMSNIIVGVKIDDAYPYSDMEQLDFHRMWTDKENTIAADDAGNEFASEQILYNNYYYDEAFDEAVKCNEKYMVYLTEGNHKVSLFVINDKVQIQYFKFASSCSPKNYTIPTDKKQCYKGDAITIEGEKAAVKSSYYLIGKSDNSSIQVTPQSAKKNLINYIGGGNWKNVGDTIVWTTPDLEPGYYQIGFSYRQNSNIGGKSYRLLTIDGEVPFAEAEKVEFSYTTEWKQSFFESEKGNPYLVYFDKGKHEIALSVTAAEMTTVRTMLAEAIAMLGDLYVDITKITGENVDTYRDYDLFTQISDMQERLETIHSLLTKSGKVLLDLTGEKSGSKYSVVINMAQTIEQMLNNKYEAHKFKDRYYSSYCSVSSVLQELREMPLDIDKITLTAVGEEEPFESYGFFKQLLFSATRFIVSFTKDYNTVSSSQNDSNSITIWVNWGRDQAQVLNSLVKRSFIPKTGINVNLKLVNATVIQALLSGNGPDCFLQMHRSEPVNLAMRGVLLDLSSFDDCESILNRFQNGADVPYRYCGGLYALPDSQNFFMMFYRKDILDEYGLSVPKTWDEFNVTAKLLMRNNMSVWLPITAVTDASTTGGVGNTSMLPTFLLQNGIKLYDKDGKKTNLLSAEAMEVFGMWTSYYTKLKFPKTLDFYNRFRTGTTPLGISTYNTYNTIKAAASEIDGLWGVSMVPGTVLDDKTVSHTTSGGGTGCVILNSSDNKDGAWEFLKWWTSSKTQFTYSNDLESVLGPTGRVAVSNIEAMKNLSWDKEDLEQILNAWKNVEEVPEYPGSYYVSRSIYQAYWNVVNSNKNEKDMLMKFGNEANDEIARKWNQYTNRTN